MGINWRKKIEITQIFKIQLYTFINSIFDDQTTDISEWATETVRKQFISSCFYDWNF